MSGGDVPLLSKRFPNRPCSGRLDGGKPLNGAAPVPGPAARLPSAARPARRRLPAARLGSAVMGAREHPPADQTAYWDRVAGQKEFTHPLDAGVLERRFERGWRILDHGCGYGRLTAALADAGYRALGADRSAQMIRCGRAARPDLELLVLAPGPL